MKKSLISPEILIIREKCGPDCFTIDVIPEWVCEDTDVFDVKWGMGVWHGCMRDFIFVIFMYGGWGMDRPT